MCHKQESGTHQTSSVAGSERLWSCFPSAVPPRQSVRLLSVAILSSSCSCQQLLPPAPPHFSVCVSAHQDRSLSNAARSSNSFTFTQAVGDTLPLEFAQSNTKWDLHRTDQHPWIMPSKGSKLHSIVIKRHRDFSKITITIKNVMIAVDMGGKLWCVLPWPNDWFICGRACNRWVRIFFFPSSSVAHSPPLSLPLSEQTLDSVGRSRQESLSSIEEDDYDTLDDIDSDKNIVRTKVWDASVFSKCDSDADLRFLQRDCSLNSRVAFARPFTPWNATGGADLRPRRRSEHVNFIYIE